jgi:hypothetical protein
VALGLARRRIGADHLRERERRERLAAVAVDGVRVEVAVAAAVRRPGRGRDQDDCPEQNKRCRSAHDHLRENDDASSRLFHAGAEPSLIETQPTRVHLEP